MAAEKIIVLVSDRDDSKHGEVSVLDDPQKAERLVETLIEAGFEQERIRVFSGRQSDYQISQRPVVALVEEGAAPQPVPAAPARQQEAAPAPQPADAADAGEADAETAEGEKEPVEAGAPVRFSSLFRSA